MKVISNDDISAFLFYGYVPKSDQYFLDNIIESKLQDNSKKHTDSLIVAGSEALKYTFESLVKTNNSCSGHLVPLSGGLDSRAILGGLLEYVDPKSICAITFGSPEAWDYEIGKMVAKVAGVRSEHIDLTSDTWNWHTEDLVNSARELNHPIWIFDKYVNSHINKLLKSSTSKIWSGFMGDPIAGSHLLREPSNSWKYAQEHFIYKNRFCSNLELFPPGYSALQILPAKPLCNQDLLTMDEQLDFAVRQAGPIQQVVAPNAQNYITPFLDKRWVSFILNTPYEMRLGQSLYNNILMHSFPRLFSLPTKTLKGLPLTASKARRIFNRYILGAKSTLLKLTHKDLMRTRSINYIDFDNAIRTNKAFRSMVEENISDLKKRGICDWIDMQYILHSHLNNNQDLARGITQLVSLEIYLKTTQL